MAEVLKLLTLKIYRKNNMKLAMGNKKDKHKKKFDYKKELDKY